MNQKWTKRFCHEISTQVCWPVFHMSKSNWSQPKHRATVKLPTRQYLLSCSILSRRISQTSGMSTSIRWIVDWCRVVRAFKYHHGYHSSHPPIERERERRKSIESPILSFLLLVVETCRMDAFTGHWLEKWVVIERNNKTLMCNSLIVFFLTHEMINHVIRSEKGYCAPRLWRRKENNHRTC